MIAAAFLLTTPMMAYADNSGGDNDAAHQDGGWHHGTKDHMFAKVLNLTDDQQKQLKDSWKKQKETMKGVFEQIKANREAFDAEIVKATPDMNKVNEIQAQIKVLQGQMADDQLNSLLEVKKIMTPEQFAGYMALKKEKMLKKHMMGHDKFKHGNWDDKQDHGNDE